MKDERAEPRAEPQTPPPEEPHPFERFTEFARRIVSVPKAEIMDLERAHRAKKPRSRDK